MPNGRLRPRAKPWFDRLSSLGLVLVVVLLVVVNLGDVLSVFGTGAILSGLLFVALGYAVGWALGGPAPDTRTVLALGTAQRNIAAALVVGSQSFTNPRVVVMVVVVAIVSLLILLPLSSLLARKNHSMKKEKVAVSSSDNPMSAVLKYVDGFNNGDQKAMAEACADPMQILDGMSPHVWQGPTAAQNWYADALAEGEHLGVTNYHIGLGEPRHVDMSGDFAYVVVPATLDYKLQGNQVNQTGAVFTFALRKVETEWRLSAWAWAKGTTDT
jgi:ketosteroid isomerase-like protein